MSIVNRRNAVVGWLTVKVAKKVVKQKTADAAASPKTGAVAGAAALGTALLFWRKKRADDSSTE
jgi:hypothetical protein